MKIYAVYIRGFNVGLTFNKWEALGWLSEASSNYGDNWIESRVYYRN